MRVFLSYRRQDVGGHAGRLADALVQRLGSKGVFHDVSAIAPGDDFTAAIDRGLAASDAVVAVIGPGWLHAVAADGSPRLWAPDDYVRQEIARALQKGLRVVPVLVGGARLPSATELTEDIADLVRRQAVVVRDEAWHQDVDGLVRTLRGEPAAPHRTRRMWLAVAAATAVLSVSGMVWWAVQGDEQSSAEGVPPPCAPPEGGDWRPVAIGEHPPVALSTDGGSLLFTVRDTQARPRGGDWQVVVATSMENATPGEQYHGDYRYDAVVVGQRSFDVSCYSAAPELVRPGTVGDALVGFDVGCEPTGYIQLVLEDGSAMSVTPAGLDWGPC